MKNLISENLEIIVTEENNFVKMEWFGSSDLTNLPEVLHPYLECFVLNYKGKKLLMDYTNLKFLSYTTFPFIIKLVKSCANFKMKVTIKYSEDIEWQKEAFKALKSICLFMNLTNVYINRD